MRLIPVLCAILLLCGLAVGQQAAGGFVGYWGCTYGCGPFVPVVTTPMVSLQTISPSPSGASNATGGLSAGATNSTISEIPASPSAVYTQPVWYSAATTSVPPAPPVPLGIVAGALHPREHRMKMEKEKAVAMVIGFPATEPGPNAAELAASAKGGKKATRTITNADVDRLNQQTGVVKYDNKTEKLQ